MNQAISRCALAVLVFALCLFPGTGQGETGWTEVQIRLLPDGSFAVIETDDKGVRHRHCPHHDSNGHLHVDQLIYALGTLQQIQWHKPSSETAARKHLRRHYERFASENDRKLGLVAVNINTGALQDLVRLPGIGPVLAVRIANYRQHHARFLTIEDIMKVDGISRGTFNAICHYIEVD